MPTGGEANGPAEVMKAVREQIAAGADVIKMFGSVGGFDNVNTNQTFGYEEMKAAVETAHAFGKKIAIHSYGADGARDAARAAPDSIEHAVDVDDATLKQMAAKNIVYVSTVGHNQSLLGPRRLVRLCPWLCREVCRLHCAEQGNTATGDQGGREDRDGVRCRVRRLGRERARPSHLRRVRHDARAGTRDDDDGECDARAE